MKRLAFVVCIAALAIAAFSCGKSEPAAPPARDEHRPLDTVRMNANVAISYAPAAIAKAEGYFKEEGIDFEPARIDSNSALLALASGKLDVVENPVRSGLFNMMVRGVPFQIVADSGHAEPGPCSTEGFTAPPELADEVARNGLRGQRFAFVKGGLTEFMITRLLAAHGLTPNDVVHVEYPPGESVMGHRRVLDAIRFSAEPSMSVQVRKGLVKVVARGNDVAPGHQLSVIGYGERLLHEDPDLGRRFMRAWLRGVRRLDEGPTDRNVAIISAYTGMPADMIRGMCWPTMNPDGQVRPEAVEPLLDWTRKKGYLEADVPLSVWWNPTFADEASHDLDAAGKHK